MTTDAATTTTAEDAIPARISQPGGPARTAALLLLARQPGGVLLHDLWQVMRAADARVASEVIASNVMQALRRDGRAATERDANLQRVWYSPAARYTAEVRRQANWQPPQPSRC